MYNSTTQRQLGGDQRQDGVRVNIKILFLQFYFLKAQSCQSSVKIQKHPTYLKRLLLVTGTNLQLPGSTSVWGKEDAGDKSSVSPLPGHPGPVAHSSCNSSDKSRVRK